MPFHLVNSRNSLEVIAGPLSDARTSGNPCVANTVGSFSTVVVVDVDATTCASIHFECASTTTSTIFP